MKRSQIQALDRTQPGLPLKKGRCGTMTHDYKRNGTTSLFAALEVSQGRVIGQCYERHRHQEFLKFLRRHDHEFPGEIPLHLVMDNYGTHKHPRVQAWLQRHPRFISHFVPTISSWLNLVERWFGELTSKRIRRGSFGSVEDLETANRAVPGRLEREPETLRLDCHRGINRRKAIPLSTNFGKDSARLYPTTPTKRETLSWPVI
jgi:transposase